jgi:hypothetical protein
MTLHSYKYQITGYNRGTAAGGDRPSSPARKRTRNTHRRMKHHAPHFLLFLLLVLLSWTTTIFVQAMVLRVPLPGGRSISFNQDTGVLRINLEPESDRKGPSSGVPPLGTVPLEQVLDSIQVRDTGTPKGFGAFCSSDCDDESFLGFYQGETIISRTELDARITKRKISTKDNDGGGGGGGGLIRNAMDYVMSLDGGVTFIDGYERYVRVGVNSTCIALYHDCIHAFMHSCIQAFKQPTTIWYCISMYGTFSHHPQGTGQKIIFTSTLESCREGNARM